MSRRNYQAIAGAIRGVWYDSSADQARVARAVGRALRDLAPYDINGNKRFDLDKFVSACGVLPAPARNGGEPCPSPGCIQDAYHGGDHRTE